MLVENDFPYRVFPVVYSTFASQALIEWILPLYGIEQVASCQFWHRGLSDVYLVETRSHRYILRISHAHWRSSTDIEFELELLDFLRSRHLPVAHPLRTVEGKLAISIDAPEGERYAALFTYAPGQVPLGDLSLAQAITLGATVAKLHQATVEFQPRYQRQELSLEYLLDQSFRAIAPFLQPNSPDLHYLQDTIDQIKQQIWDFPKQPPYWVVCWGDPHSGNAHFTTDQTVTLFDFDQCGYGWRAFELAKFLQVSLGAGISPKVRQAFITGYQSVQPLTDPEVAAIQPFTQTAHIWAWAICINHETLHNYSRLDRHYFHFRLQQLKMLRSPDWRLC